jgi:hypothetical protein
VFCKAEGSSEEHVWAKWISRIVPGEGKFQHASDDPRHRTRSVKIIDVTNRSTCESCNHGWMSDFETRARELLADPICGIARSYPTNEQIAVAAWAFKTSCMLDCSWRGRTMPEHHYRHLFRFRVPPTSVHIWFTSYAPAKGEEFRSAWAKRVGLELAAPSIGRRHGYRLTFSVGHLVFHVFGHVGSEKLHYPTLTVPSGEQLSDFFRPVWPITELDVSWPPPSDSAPADWSTSRITSPVKAFPFLDYHSVHSSFGRILVCG